MEIMKQESGDIAILNLIGKLDINTTAPLEAKIQEVIDGGKSNIVMNLSDLDFIASSGLRVLLVAGKKLKTASGKLVLCALQDHVKEVFEISGFTMLFSIYATQNEAVGSF